MDDYVITKPTDDLGLMDIVKDQLEGKDNEFDRPLDNSGAYNHSINSYYFYLEDIPRSIVLLNLPNYSIDYSKAFDKLKMHYA